MDIRFLRANRQPQWFDHIKLKDLHTTDYLAKQYSGIPFPKQMHAAFRPSLCNLDVTLIDL